MGLRSQDRTGGQVKNRYEELSGGLQQAVNRLIDTMAAIYADDDYAPEFHTRKVNELRQQIMDSYKHMVERCRESDDRRRRD